MCILKRVPPHVEHSTRSSCSTAPTVSLAPMLAGNWSSAHRTSSHHVFRVVGAPGTYTDSSDAGPLSTRTTRFLASSTRTRRPLRFSTSQPPSMMAASARASFTTDARRRAAAPSGVGPVLSAREPAVAVVAAAGVREILVFARLGFGAAPRARRGGTGAADFCAPSAGAELPSLNASLLVLMRPHFSTLIERPGRRLPYWYASRTGTAHVPATSWSGVLPRRRGV